MDSTRRGFLELLAHLPLVGAWLGRPKEVHKQIDDTFALADRMLDQGIRVIRWIPVTERLPRDRMGVLTLQRAGDSLWYDMGIVEDGKWTLLGENNSKAISPSILAVSYWAELPSPPPAQICAQ